MISEHKCRTIVMLCNLEEDGKVGGRGGGKGRWARRRER